MALPPAGRPALLEGVAYAGRPDVEFVNATRPLLAFLSKLARVLDEEFAEPRAARSEDYEEVPYDYERKTVVFGDARAGFRLAALVGSDAGSGFTDRHALTVTAYGLSGGRHFEFEHVDFVPPFGSRRPEHYVELRVEGPREVTREILRAFAEAFEKDERADAPKALEEAGALEGAGAREVREVVGESPRVLHERRGFVESLRALWWRPYGGGIRQPYGTLLSVALAVFAVLFLPRLLGGVFTNRAALVFAVLLLFPALPALRAVLQGEVEPAPVNLFTLYFCEAFDLYFNLIFVLLIIPYLALKVLWALGLVFLVAVTAGLCAGLLKPPHAVEPAVLRYFLAALGVAGASTAALVFLAGREDSLIRRYAGLRLALLGRVRRLNEEGR